MKDAFARIPTQQELLLPLLEVLQANGPLKAGDAVEAVADKLSVSGDVRALTTEHEHSDGYIRETNVFARKVRWVRQNAVLAGLISKARYGIWELAESGHKNLTMAKPGVVVTVARDEHGGILWAEAMSAVGYLEKGSISAIISSPPYPLARQREYGGWQADRYLDTLLQHIDAFRPLLAADGSMILNLGDVYYRGLPALNTYQERLVIALEDRKWHLCGKHHWINPCKPKTTPYVTQSRERCAAAVENFFWWSPSPNASPKADNRRALVPYTEGFRRKCLDRGGELRTDNTRGARQSHRGLRYRTDNGGAIPFNYTIVSHEGSGSAYTRHCKAHGLPVHPARMPVQLVEHFMKLTTEPGDVVFDPFVGSLVVPAVAARLGRNYIGSEKCLDYIKGGLFRLKGNEALEDFTSDFRIQAPLSA